MESDKEPARYGLAKPSFISTPVANLFYSILASNNEQLKEVYSAAGLKEWENDLKLAHDNNFTLEPLAKNLSSSKSDPFIKKMYDFVIGFIKTNPDARALAVKEIALKLRLRLDKDKEKKPDLKPIKEQIELYDISGAELVKQLLFPIFDPKKAMGNSGITNMKTGSSEHDVKKFFKLIDYLEEVSDFKANREKLSEALLEKSFSKYLEKDYFHGLPLTEDINYLAKLPELLSLDIHKLDFVPKYAESGYFNKVIGSTLNRAIKAGGAIPFRYVPENMQKFAKLYEKFIDFDSPEINEFIDQLKNRDETGELKKHSAKEILFDETLNNLLYQQIFKSETIEQVNLLGSMRSLGGSSFFKQET